MASATLTVKLKLPVAVGVPESKPADDKVSPAGKVPALKLKLTAPTPPVCVKVWL